MNYVIGWNVWVYRAELIEYNLIVK